MACKMTEQAEKSQKQQPAWAHWKIQRLNKIASPKTASLERYNYE
jgi:hypothetical protein